MNFSDKLAKQRKANNLSQEQLAEQLGVTRQSVSKWESGESYPDMAKIIQICKVLNCKLNDIMEDGLLDENTDTSGNRSSNTLKKVLDSFLDMITRIYNMLIHMSFKEKLKLIVEMTLIGAVLYIIGLFISEGIEYFLYKILYLIPLDKASYIIGAVIMLVVDTALIVLALIILTHLFKIRYLDYYVTLTDDNVTAQTIEEPIKENISELKKDSEPRVIIRDPKHSSSAFLDSLVNGLVVICKFILIIFAIPVLVCVLLAVAASFFCLFHHGLILKYLAVAIFGILIFGVMLLLIIFNILFNHKQQYRLLLAMFICSILISGIGAGAAGQEISKVDVVSDFSITALKSEVISLSDIKDNDCIYILSNNIEYMIDENSEDIIMEFSYPDDSAIYLNSIVETYANGETEYYYNLDNDSFYMFRLIINDFGNGIVHRSYDSCDLLSVKITCNSRNREKLANLGY